MSVVRTPGKEIQMSIKVWSQQAKAGRDSNTNNTITLSTGALGPGWLWNITITGPL